MCERPSERGGRGGLNEGGRKKVKWGRSEGKREKEDDRLGQRDGEREREGGSE